MELQVCQKGGVQEGTGVCDTLVTQRDTKISQVRKQKRPFVSEIVPGCQICSSGHSSREKKLLKCSIESEPQQQHEQIVHLLPPLQRKGSLFSQPVPSLACTGTVTRASTQRAENYRVLQRRIKKNHNKVKQSKPCTEPNRGKRTRWTQVA